MYCDAMYTTNGLTDRNNWATQFQAPPGPSKSMQSPIHLESPCHGWRCWNKQNWFVSNLCTAKFDDGHVGPRPLTNLHIYLWNPYVIITAWWFQTFLIFHILGRLIPTDFHIFQRCWNHQPDHHFDWLKHVQTQFGNVAQLVPAGPRSNKQPAMVAAPKWSYSCWGKSKFCWLNQSVHDPHGSVDDFLQIPPIFASKLTFFGLVPFYSWKPIVHRPLRAVEKRQPVISCFRSEPRRHSITPSPKRGSRPKMQQLWPGDDSRDWDAEGWDGIIMYNWQPMAPGKRQDMTLAWQHFTMSGPNMKIVTASRVVFLGVLLLYHRNGITVARSHQSKKVFRCEQLTPVSVLSINPEIGQDLKRTPSIYWGIQFLYCRDWTSGNFRRCHWNPPFSGMPSRSCWVCTIAESVWVRLELFLRAPSLPLSLPMALRRFNAGGKKQKDRSTSPGAGRRLLIPPHTSIGYHPPVKSSSNSRTETRNIQLQILQKWKNHCPASAHHTLPLVQVDMSKSIGGTQKKNIWKHGRSCCIRPPVDCGYLQSH